MADLTSELQRMADDAASQTRPPAVAEIIRQGDRRRRRSLARQRLGGLTAVGIAGAGITLGLVLAASVGTHSTGVIRTAAFTLVSNADGTATLTVNPRVLLEPGTLQGDLARDGIRARVTVGSFCYSDPAPAGLSRVVLIQGSPGSGSQPQHGPDRTVTINPAAMPAGTELSFGNFQLTNSIRTVFALISTNSYMCTSTVPTGPQAGVAMIFNNGVGVPLWQAADVSSWGCGSGCAD
jgi:hypothetical protein